MKVNVAASLDIFLHLK